MTVSCGSFKAAPPHIPDTAPGRGWLSTRPARACHNTVS
jgi:hypothetical protein